MLRTIGVLNADLDGQGGRIRGVRFRGAWDFLFLHIADTAMRGRGYPRTGIVFIGLFQLTRVNSA